MPPFLSRAFALIYFRVALKTQRGYEAIVRLYPRAFSVLAVVRMCRYYSAVLLPTPTTRHVSSGIG
jgi:hypothetical protein